MGNVGDLRKIATGTTWRSAKEREGLKIPLVTDSSAVRLVTDKRICDKVLTGFRAANSGWSSQPTALYVVQVGTVFAGIHHKPLPPAPPNGVRTGVTTYVVVLDSRYRFLSKYAY